MSPWQELGIEPTGEVGAIRKAYAARLKKSRPEDDPAGFVRLRAAYEAALALAPRLAPQGEAAKTQLPGDGKPTGPAQAEFRPPEAPPPLNPKIQVAPLESETPGPSGGRPSGAERPEIRRRPADTPEDVTKPERDQGPAKPTIRSAPIATETGEDTPDRPQDQGKPTIRAAPIATETDGDTPDRPLDHGKPTIRAAPLDAEDGQDRPAAKGPQAIRSRPIEPRETDARETRVPPPLDRGKPVVRTAPVDLRAGGGAPKPVPRPAAAESLLTPESAAAISSISAALDRRLSEEAANQLLIACSRHLLPLRTEFVLKDRLAALLLADDKIPIDRLVSFTRQFGWYDEADILRSRGDTAQNRLSAKVATVVAAERERDRAAAAERDRLRKEAVEHARRQEALTRRASFKDLGRVLLLFFFVLILLGGVVRTLGPPPHIGAVQPATQPAPARVVPPPRVQAPVQTAVAPVPRETLVKECRAGFAEPAELAAQPLSELLRCGQRGAPGAENALGLRYLAGQGVQRDDLVAASWFKAAADQGHAEARRNLAQMLRSGRGVTKDAAKARELYLQGAQKDDLIAQLQLAEMLITGAGGAAAPRSGFAWARAAALHGYVPAMTRVGTLYADGTGTARDPAKSAAWRLAAAEAGDPAAMQAYGMMALSGTGMTADAATAYRWLSLAAGHGARDGPERQRAGHALPAPQRAAIDGDVKQWQPSTPAPPAADTSYDGPLEFTWPSGPQK